MNRPRPGRSLFLAYLCCSLVAVLLAAPLLSAVEPASAGASRDGALTFARADRNADGYVDAREAQAVPGLAAAFAQADANADGRLDQIEFAKAPVRRWRK